MPLKNNFIWLILMSFSIGITACKNENTLKQKPQTTAKTEHRVDGKLADKKANNFLNSSSYQYEYQTRTIGKYKYDYDVTGTDEEKNNVHGSINIEGKNGNGILIGNDGMEIEIVVERISDSKLLATDIEGNEYKLKID